MSGDEPAASYLAALRRWPEVVAKINRTVLADRMGVKVNVVSGLLNHSRRWTATPHRLSQALDLIRCCGGTAGDLDQWTRYHIEVATYDASDGGRPLPDPPEPSPLLPSAPSRPGAAPPPSPADTAPTFGVITGAPEDYVAVQAVLDGAAVARVADDRAPYVAGTMPSAVPGTPHEVVLTMLGEGGPWAAADGVAHLTRSFRGVQCVVMVGAAIAVEGARSSGGPVRLGDVVVADVVVDEPAQELGRTPIPSPLLRRIALLLAADAQLGARPWEAVIADARSRSPEVFPLPEGGATPTGAVHLGRIGSSAHHGRGVLAVEREGTGIGAASFAGGREWFVVRGMTGSRASSAENRCAALTAAGYTRALLAAVPPLSVRPDHFRLT